MPIYFEDIRNSKKEFIGFNPDKINNEAYCTYTVPFKKTPLDITETNKFLKIFEGIRFERSIQGNDIAIIKDLSNFSLEHKPVRNHNRQKTQPLRATSFMAGVRGSTSAPDLPSLLRKTDLSKPLLINQSSNQNSNSLFDLNEFFKDPSIYRRTFCYYTMIDSNAKNIKEFCQYGVFTQSDAVFLMNHLQNEILHKIRVRQLDNLIKLYKVLTSAYDELLKIIEPNDYFLQFFKNAAFLLMTSKDNEKTFPNNLRILIEDNFDVSSFNQHFVVCINYFKKLLEPNKEEMKFLITESTQLYNAYLAVEAEINAINHDALCTGPVIDLNAFSTQLQNLPSAKPYLPAIRKLPVYQSLLSWIEGRTKDKHAAKEHFKIILEKFLELCKFAKNPHEINSRLIKWDAAKILEDTKDLYIKKEWLDGLNNHKNSRDSKGNKHGIFGSFLKIVSHKNMDLGEFVLGYFKEKITLPSNDNNSEQRDSRRMSR